MGTWKNLSPFLTSFPTIGIFCPQYLHLFSSSRSHPMMSNPLLLITGLPHPGQ
jgi:hypothetical protein